MLILLLSFNVCNTVTYIWRNHNVILSDLKVRITCTGLGRPLRFHEVKAPRFHDNRHMKVVRLSALGTGRLYLQEISVALINVRGCIDLRAIVRPEGLCQWKIPMTPSKIEPVTLRLLASIKCATACPILPYLDTLNWFLSTLLVGGLLTTSTSATNIFSSTEFHKAAQQMTWTLTLFLLHASIPLQHEDYFSLCPPSFPYHFTHTQIPDVFCFRHRSPHG